MIQVTIQADSSLSCPLTQVLRFRCSPSRLPIILPTFRFSSFRSNNLHGVLSSPRRWQRRCKWSSFDSRVHTSESLVLKRASVFCERTCRQFDLSHPLHDGWEYLGDPLALYATHCRGWLGVVRQVGCATQTASTTAFSISPPPGGALRGARC